MAKRDEDRDRRLAEALRANLRRRKAQAREVTNGLSESSEAGPLHPPAPSAQDGPPPRTGEE